MPLFLLAFSISQNNLPAAPPPKCCFFRLMGSPKYGLSCITPCDAPSVVDFCVFTYQGEN